jgi:hypothetical protein
MTSRLKFVNIIPTHYLHYMITPKQQALLSKLMQQHPELATLQLEPIPSPEYKYSKAVSARVDTILQELKNKPIVKRSDSLTAGPTALGRIFASQAIINQYITKIYGQQPWTTPLKTAPF